MAVEEHDPPEAHGRQADRDVLDDRHERGDPQVDDTGEPDVRVRQPVVDRRARRRRRARGATRRATSTGTRTSVSNGPCGPCCSVEPIGTRTVSWSRTNASTSGFVISPRNTVGGFIVGPPLVTSGDMGGELADPLDPAASRRRPAWRWRSGPGGDASRTGVPVAIRSPGASSTWRLRKATISATEKRMSDVRPSWIASPLIVQPRRRSAGSRSAAGTTRRTGWAEPGHRLAEQPLVAIEPRVARRDVVHDRVAEDEPEGLLGRHVPGGLADHDAQLDLGVDVGGQRPVPVEPGAVAGDRGRGLAVDERPFGSDSRVPRRAPGSSARPCRSRRDRGHRAGPSRQAVTVGSASSGATAARMTRPCRPHRSSARRRWPPGR